MVKMHARKSKIFYGWYVAIACFLFELVSLGMANGTSSLYVKPICDSMGFSRGAYSVAFTVASLSSMAAYFCLGFIIKKLKGVRVVFLLGLVLMTGAFSIYSLAQGLIHFYIGAAMMGMAISFSATVPLSIIVNNWFYEKRGMVFGAVFAGSGIGGSLLNPLVGKWIASVGWRVSYRYSLLLVLIICIPALLVLRDKPSDMGLKAYGSDRKTTGSIPVESSGLTLKEALKKKAFWFMITASLFVGIAIQPIYLNSSVHMEGKGLNPQTIAVIMSFVFVSNTVSKLLLGAVNDKCGIRPVLLINHLCYALSVLILIFTQSNMMGFSFAILYGIGYTAVSITPPLLVTQLFGQKDSGSLMGIIVAVQTAGASLGTPLAGFCFDMYHTYSYAFLLLLLLDLIGVSLMLKLLTDRKKEEIRQKAFSMHTINP